MTLKVLQAEARKLEGHELVKEGDWLEWQLGCFTTVDAGSQLIGQEVKDMPRVTHVYHQRAAEVFRFEI